MLPKPFSYFMFLYNILEDEFQNNMLQYNIYRRYNMELTTHQHGHGQLCETQSSDGLLFNQKNVIPSLING